MGWENNMNYMEMLIEGLVTESEIDDYIDKWHEDERIKCSLNEYLGMSWDEYSLWATKPSSLSSIVFARNKLIKFKLDIKD